MWRSLKNFWKRIITFSSFLNTRGDPARNDFTPEDDQFPEEPKYDKFAYENDKKMWGLDNGFNEDEGMDGLTADGRKERRLHYTSGAVHTKLIATIHCLTIGNLLSWIEAITKSVKILTSLHLMFHIIQMVLMNHIPRPTWGTVQEEEGITVPDLTIGNTGLMKILWNDSTEKE